MDLKIRGWLSMPNYVDLKYIANNCGGQNKNMRALRFLMWLVEAKIFPKGTLFFLVKGHTKESADCMFKLLKLNYHCQDIFTNDELHSVLSENEFVNVIKMAQKSFMIILSDRISTIECLKRENLIQGMCSVYLD